MRFRDLEKKGCRELEVFLSKRDITSPMVRKARRCFIRETLKEEPTWNRVIASRYTNYVVRRYLKSDKCFT